MGGGYNLRHLGMIATSGSWRRWFFPVIFERWKRKTRH